MAERMEEAAAEEDFSCGEPMGDSAAGRQWDTEGSGRKRDDAKLAVATVVEMIYYVSSHQLETTLISQDTQQLTGAKPSPSKKKFLKGISCTLTVLSPYKPWLSSISN